VMNAARSSRWDSMVPVSHPAPTAPEQGGPCALGWPGTRMGRNRRAITRRGLPWPTRAAGGRNVPDAAPRFDKGGVRRWVDRDLGAATLTDADEVAGRSCRTARRHAWAAGTPSGTNPPPDTPGATSRAEARHSRLSCPIALRRWPAAPVAGASSSRGPGTRLSPSGKKSPCQGRGVGLSAGSDPAGQERPGVVEAAGAAQGSAGRHCVRPGFWPRPERDKAATEGLRGRSGGRFGPRAAGMSRAAVRAGWQGWRHFGC